MKEYVIIGLIVVFVLAFVWLIRVECRLDREVRQRLQAALLGIKTK